MHSKYLLDSNIFIQSYNLNYHPSFCNGFWDWIIQGHSAGKFYSIDKVKKELLHPAESEDELSKMLRSDIIPTEFFINSITDHQVVDSYSKLMDWAYKSTHFLQKAKDEFARAEVADAYLVATAMAHGYVIVTAEKSNPAARSRILIPDIALAFGVECINLTSLLRKHAHNNFQLL